MNDEKYILLHGAVNSSNFGDCLFVDLYYRTIKSIEGITPIFVEGRYGISEFNRREINYERHISEKLQNEADGLIYIAGGYFGDDNSPWIMSIRRWLRYFRIGEKYIRKGRPILVSGVGGGSIKARITRLSANRIIAYSDSVLVRDLGTAEYYSECRKNASPIVLTYDTALSITSDILPDLEEQTVAELDKFGADSEFVFLHLTGEETSDNIIYLNILPAVKKLLEQNHNMHLIVGFDCIMRDDIYESVLKKIDVDIFYFYKYHSAWQLCSLLNKMDLIITSKLHVGIVGSALSKSVVSFPKHPYKTKRFYESINEEERCVELSKIDSDSAFVQIKKYYKRPINIVNDIREKARMTLTICEKFVKNKIQ